MIKGFLIGAVGVMLLVATISVADEYSVCRGKCDKNNSDCIARITAVNDIEVEDAQVACSKEESDCHDDCNENINKVQEQPQKAPEVQQEQGETINGNIKVYQFR